MNKKRIIKIVLITIFLIFVAKMVSTEVIKYKIAKDLYLNIEHTNKYTNSEIGFTIDLPDSCGEPVINKYYQRLNGQVVQGTFESCPVRSFSARVPGIILDNDDTSFGDFKNKIEESAFNFVNEKGLKGYVKYTDPNTEMGDLNMVYYSFNTNSEKYPVVTFVGDKTEPGFINVVNSVIIK